MWFKRIKCCAFGCNLTLKSTWLWWETNSNQQSSREKETVVKRKTRAKRGFPSHKSSPKKERKQKREKERKQESVTHSVDFFLLLLFLYFLRTRNSIATPPCAVIETERASKAATLKETHKKRETTKNKPNLMLATRFTCCAQNVVPFFLSRARVTKVTPASRKTKRWEFTKVQLAGRASSSSKQLSDHSEH